MCASAYHIGCPEVELQNDAIHVQIGEAAVEQWHPK